jgi:hypothetical protein
MAEKHKIDCKTHDSQGRVTHVGFDGKTEPVGKVHDMIKSTQHEFYTEDKRGNRADVNAGKSSAGRKYLSTVQDGITDNNLDEITDCSCKRN